LNPSYAGGNKYIKYVFIVIFFDKQLTLLSPPFQNLMDAKFIMFKENFAISDHLYGNKLKS